MNSSKVNKRSSPTEQFIVLSRVGAALLSERNEQRLLQLIAQTACEIIGADFAAFTLRPIGRAGEFLVPSEGNLFRLAAVVGVTAEQEAWFRQTSLGGEGMLAPIFRHGVSVLIDDVLAHVSKQDIHGISTLLASSAEERLAAHNAAVAYAHGEIETDQLRSLGVPAAHPIVRSFLGAPLLNRDQQVIGGLLLGHNEPAHFKPDDEQILIGLATQAAVALENARLYRAEKARTQEMRAIFESITDGVTLVNKEGRITHENPAARYLRERIMTQREGVQILEDFLFRPAQQAQAGETWGGPSINIPIGNGETQDYVVNAMPLRFALTSDSLIALEPSQTEQVDSTTEAVVVWHDVTEARRLLLERRLHAEIEARYKMLQAILDELPSSVYLVHGPKARLVLANHATSKVWGAQWMPGQSMHDFLTLQHIQIFGVDGHPLQSEQLATLRAVSGEAVYQHQESIRRADGTILPVLVNAVVLQESDVHFSSDGTSEQEQEMVDTVALVVHQDVTALKEAERLKDDFIGIAAHELRTPLTVLRGFVQTLLIQTARGRGVVLAEWQQEALTAIDQATGRLTELTDDLLDVTRLQAGRLTLYPEPFDLVALARRVVTRYQIMSTQHQFITNNELDHLVVLADPRRIEQVLGNLLNNAVKYSPQGGEITLTLKKTDEGEMALLSICDPGMGIPTDQQSRIFGRFVRAENVSIAGIGGTGLGLYLCRELVTQQGGHVWFESQEGQGSTFFVTLPLVNLEESPPAIAE